MNILKFFKRFPDEETCKKEFLQYRLNEGVICKKCQGKSHWWLPSKDQFKCSCCHFRTTLKSGTVMENTKLPFQYWFIAFHLLTATKKSFSALEVQKQLGHKRYEPVWLLLHKIRIVMGKRDRKYKLSGIAEMDEGFFESVPSKERRKSLKGEERKRGRGSQKQTKVLVAAESKPIPKAEQTKHKPARKVGYLKMEVMVELNSAEINYEVKQMMKSDTRVLTDGWKGYAKLKEIIANHKVKVVDDPAEASKIFPWVHTAIGNAKKILQGIHHSVGSDYVQNYLNEFCYKFNRRYLRGDLFDRLLIASVSNG